MTAIVDCPVCARRTEFSPANRWRPFCSERCKTDDLGAWASNAYVIAGKSLEEDAEGLDADRPDHRPPHPH